MFGSLLDKLFTRPLTEDAFAEKVIKAAREAGFSEPLEYVPKEFRLKHGDGGYFNLHNAFSDYQSADKAHKSDVLKGYVSTLLSYRKEAPQSFEDVKLLLRPVIRNLAMLEEVRLHHVRSEGWDAPFATVHQTLGKDCVTLLAVDYPETTSTLTEGPKENWGVSLGEALAVAVSNLREATWDAFDEIVPGLYVGRWNDGYDTSRVLLPDVLQRAAIKGRPVFMIPTRDILMVTGDKDEEGIRHMVEVSFKAMEAGRAVSSQVYTYDDKRIVPFISQDETLKARMASLEHRLLQGNYHVQKEQLDTIHEEQKIDVFVATYTLFELKDSNGKTFSMCSWTETVDTLLPKTDRVALVQIQPDGTAQTQVVEWDELEAKLGELLTPASLYPPRYRTLGFPTAVQLNQLTPLV
ncbi:DUF1444 family protein [Pseudomonas sp. 1152_12]|uniref:DUF1444 family protein n=1 Tax=Pseudomonas sp. 1152_12 TaxID=2604455 RepID=UPI0040635873